MRKSLSISLTMLWVLLAPQTWAADFTIGQEAYNCGDYETALAEWSALADSGQSNAQYSMGLLYTNGFGVPMDDAAALHWYTAAADQGHAEAMHSIAIIHANGWGVPQSDAEAFKWYGLAAENGVPPAQVALARMLSDGYWEVQDRVLAYKWLSIAAELGELSALAKRDDLASKMSAEEVGAGNVAADAWMERYQVQLAKQ